MDTMNLKIQIIKKIFLNYCIFLAYHNDEIKVVAFKNAPNILKLTSLDIQKNIVSI